MANSQNGLRAALAVSALSEGERAWLESRLSDAERAALACALDSLDDRPLAVQAADVRMRVDASGARAWEARMSALLMVIAAEPVWMQRAIGHALGAERRGRILGAAERSDVWRDRVDSLRLGWRDCPAHEAPALREAMLAQLEAQVMALPDEPVLPAQAPAAIGKPSWLSSCWGWLRHE